jgi:hypothetical protein
MSAKTADKPDVEDRASADTKVDNKKSNDKPQKGKSSQKGTSGSKPRTTPPNKTESGSGKQTPGFADGNSVLASYGLSVSGRKERILSAIKTDKFFHFVEQSWEQLMRIKPHVNERYSLAEFRHASALQLYHRIESVKFDTLGIKPSAPTRIPLPRNTRVFQPIWSILANIGYVDDDELRVLYIPDGYLPKSDDFDDEEDIAALLTCTLYDWQTSWDQVKAARLSRKQNQSREGYTPITISNETSSLKTKEQLMKEISDMRKSYRSAVRDAELPSYRLIDGYLYKVPTKQASPKGKEKASDVASDTTSTLDTSLSDEELKKGTRYWGPDSARRKLEQLMDEAKRKKQEMITPRFDTTYAIEPYTVADGSIAADPGAYGARLHWDPQLWLEYEQFVEIVTPVALFSLSMPSESVGTYAWLLPVEKRDGDDINVSARMPKANIAPVTWILSLLLQSSTLPLLARSTFYVETDRLQNVLGLRQRYIRAAIKDPSAVEQYGTY